MRLIMNQNEFLRLAAQGFNRIPVVREVLADMDTPLSTYLKLADAPYSYLFESVQGGEKWGRYTIIGLPCQTVVRVHGFDVSVEHQGDSVATDITDDPLSWVKSFQQRFRVPDVAGLPRFNGGLVGYFGYDTVRYIETRLGNAPGSDPLGCPDIMLMVSDELLVFDNLSGRLYLIVYADPARDQAYER